MERNTPKRHSGNWTYPLAADTIIHTGMLVALEGGYAVAGKEAIGLIAVGRANATADNRGGAAGAVAVEVEAGAFLWDNTAEDPVTQADAGKTCFIADGATVARSDNAGKRSVAGIVRAVDDGVWVETL